MSSVTGSEWVAIELGRLEREFGLKQPDVYKLLREDREALTCACYTGEGSVHGKPISINVRSGFRTGSSKAQLQIWSGPPRIGVLYIACRDEDVVYVMERYPDSNLSDYVFGLWHDEEGAWRLTGV